MVQGAARAFGAAVRSTKVSADLGFRLPMWMRSKHYRAVRSRLCRSSKDGWSWVSWFHEGNRITSYNVCYTKLLRATYAQSIDLYKRSLDIVKTQFAGAIASALDVARVESLLFSTETKLAQVQGQRHRITSYNVCYTKLLRKINT